MPLSQKIKIFQAICGRIAKCATLFIRSGTGYRGIDMAWMIGIAVFLYTFGSVFTWFSKRDLGGLYELYPLILLATAAYQRHKRWKEIEAGELKHSHADGVSFLEKLTWLPAALTKNAALYRVWEPALIFVGSMLIGAFISQPLGRFLALVAVADFVHESALYDFRLNIALDILDARLEAESHQKTVEHFEPVQEGQNLQASDPAEVISSGISQDILNNIQARRAKRQAFANVVSQ